MLRRFCVWFCCFVCVVLGNRCIGICRVPLFCANPSSLDQLLDIFAVPLLGDTLNFVAMCLISDRSRVDCDLDLVGHTREHLFPSWLQFCQGRTPKRVLTSALLVLSRRSLAGNPLKKGLPASVINTNKFNRSVNPLLMQCVRSWQYRNRVSR